MRNRRKLCMKMHVFDSIVSNGIILFTYGSFENIFSFITMNKQISYRLLFDELKENKSKIRIMLVRKNKRIYFYL